MAIPPPCPARPTCCGARHRGEGVALREVDHLGIAVLARIDIVRIPLSPGFFLAVVRQGASVTLFAAERGFRSR